MSEAAEAVDEPGEATARRRRLAPDIRIGPLALWIGASRGRAWLDVALRIADAHYTATEADGPLILRSALAAFPERLRAHAAIDKGETWLGSEGAPIGITLKRYAQSEANYGDVRLRRGPFEQHVSFGITRGQIDEAEAGIVRVLERLAREEEGRWRPRPESVDAVDAAAEAPPDAGAEPEPTAKAIDPVLENWDPGLGEGEDVTFDYAIDGVGWFAVEIAAGDRREGVGGSDIVDSMGELIRAALALLAGAWRAEADFNAEPQLQRIELERVRLRYQRNRAGDYEDRFGCWVRIREIEPVFEPNGLVFEALARSPLAVAEAIYRMAVPHFDERRRTDHATLAALEGALRAVKAATRGAEGAA